VIRKRFQKANSEGLESIDISLVPRKVSVRGHQGASSHDHLGDPQLGQQLQPPSSVWSSPFKWENQAVAGPDWGAGDSYRVPLLWPTIGGKGSHRRPGLWLPLHHLPSHSWGGCQELQGQLCECTWDTAPSCAPVQAGGEAETDMEMVCVCVCVCACVCVCVHVCVCV